MPEVDVRAIRYFVTENKPHVRKVGDVVHSPEGNITISSIRLTENEFGKLEYQVWVSNGVESAIWKRVPYEIAEAEEDFQKLLNG